MSLPPGGAQGRFAGDRIESSVALNLNSALGRDLRDYSSRTSSKGALLSETHAVFRALVDGLSLEDVKKACLSGRLFRQTARETRRHIWTAIHWRFFEWDPPQWVIGDYMQSAAGNYREPGFVGLVYLHYARRDRLVFDFVAEVLWFLRSRRSVEVTRSDVLGFLKDAVEVQGIRWREATLTKVAGNVLTKLRDFGLLIGRQRKRIQQPTVVPEVALHLTRLLYAEGLRGRSLIEAPDWRLFLWDVDDVAQSLAGLGRGGQLRFERLGRTVVLEMPAQQGNPT